MAEENSIYRELQKHLDKMPVSFPATQSGSEIRMLKHFYTPEEARVATALSPLKLEPLERIYRRGRKKGLLFSQEELQKILDKMLIKGTLLAYSEGFDEKRYKNAGFTAGGTFDFQVNRLTREMQEDHEIYAQEAFSKVEVGIKRVPQLRTVPVEKSISISEKIPIHSYDRVRNLVEKAPGPLAVANCVCRQGSDLKGTPCTKSEIRETCLQIGPDHARQYVEMGIARVITKEEAFQILEAAEKAGFILQPENSQNPEAICCCCGDCCGMLKSVKKSPRWSDFFATNYFAVVDSSKCTGCGTCVRRCQMEARSLNNGKSTINLDHCIGCGNCVTSCEPHASRMQLKEKEIIPPKTKDDTYWKILSGRKGKREAFKLKTRLKLGMDV
jgi:Na+-translocating ferredoxin:NAD+ oxidoreductase subunit B